MGKEMNYARCLFEHNPGIHYIKFFVCINQKVGPMPDKANFATSRGYASPFGVSRQADGLNFTLASKHADDVKLCLFDRATKKLVSEFQLSPKLNKTGDVWHILVHAIDEHFLYAYRLGPPSAPEQDLLLDPYSKSVVSGNIWGETPYVPLCDIIVDKDFDWQNDVPPNHSINDLIIYEMHVRGFTKDPSSKVTHPGTYLGLIEKIPHLLDLGINAIELLPIHEFNEQENHRKNPETDEQLYNYWGYSTVNFFAPMQRYASTASHGAALTEFKTMVKALHKHGIEVILDIVFNHTAEGGEKGCVLSFKGIDKPIYYMLDSQNHYRNYTGCGNTVNANHPVVLEMIISSLRYWVSEMHVDGFRFDLASDLCRDLKGNPMTISPVIKAITEDPVLAKVKLIAEPWDAAGLYQVGHFAAKSPRWSEWNDRYRDCVRRFIKGISGANGEFARRLSGSEDLYGDRHPSNSINFITAHDGFSLADLVSYNMKHNQQNGENNQDGHNQNESWNCGCEGTTTDEGILQLRQRQMRNFHLALMLSLGIPMVLMGDEYGHTKLGNNNAYCQDNQLNWYNWNKLEKNSGFYRFFSILIKLRKQMPLLRRNVFLTDKNIDWHGIEPMKAEWNSGISLLAYTLKGPIEEGSIAGEDLLYVAFNAQNVDQMVKLPSPPASKVWRWLVNTASPSPHDVYENGQGAILEQDVFAMTTYSAIVLEACSSSK